MSSLRVPKDHRAIKEALSRREFLKIGAIATCVTLFGGYTTKKPFDQESPPVIQQGRVIENFTRLYDQPSTNGNKLKTLWKDEVITILGATLGDNNPPHNRIWYRVGEEAFVHSGSIQPVQTRLNPISDQIPPVGILAEVTVPYTDARRSPGSEQPVAYRYYYETTHWVTGLVFDSLGDAWYLTQEDKWEYDFYVRATHLRLVSPKELQPLSPQVPPEAKRLEVRTREQVLVAYEWESPIFMTRISSGAVFREGDFSTPQGHYFAFHKRPTRHMVAGNLAASGYDLPGVPWVTYFTESGISLHGTFWHNDYGRPRSHGCVNLTPRAAKWVYLWSLPVVPADQQFSYEKDGTAVDVI